MVDKLSPTNPILPLTRPSSGERPAGESGLMRLLIESLARSPASAVTAEVRQVAPVTAEQRQQLINRLVDTLLQWQSRPESANRTQQLARLTDEQQLLNAAQLKLVRLNVQQQNVVTYTDRALKPGQQVAVYLAENRLWQLATPRAASPATGGTSPSPPSGTASGPSVISEALRRALPMKDAPDLAPALPRIDQLLSYRQQRDLFSSSLQQALRQAAQQLREPSRLTRPGGLREALSESGVFLEKKLLTALRTAARDAAAPGATTGQADRAGADAVHRVLSGDWKGALLKVLHQVRAELGRLGQSPDVMRGNELNLGALLEQVSTRSAPELADRSLRTQLLQMVHQLALHSLARVQSQQSQALTQQFAPADAGPAPQTLTLEVPMRLGQDVQPLLLRIEPEPEKDETGRRTGKIRQWQVQLSFDLPDAGTLYAQVTVRDQKVATRLWAEREPTANAIRSRLTELRQRLEKEGIEVTQLECHTGAPPRPMTDIRYSLVDITT
ncbi:flagellar hook-length control protein FliK [Marinimicrobium sp. C6131]|uniref:flagellar hook-length control protein FliK n=1 Tax=Marinimicrobium sp. C6131 TaxID=3022676 RepID=UPI00223D96AD|nr:flagellar hook-length control protein FliK [Marinimicrobium sp. C6131]UZJ45392.1 flagellar hook-length control protein FliK [Marinimicrobium sp. C6131]